jgi:hypothetical protein
MSWKPPSTRWAVLALFLPASGATAPRAAATELSVFVSRASPADNWRSGFGGTLSTTWFRAVNLEAELARQSEEFDDGGMTSFTGAALLAPRIGALRPYAGLGVGVFRQTLGSSSDTGTLGAFIIGLKAEVGLLVLKGEYRRIDLSGDPLIAMDKRFSAGIGIVF